MPKDPHILIVAGDPSADVLAAALVKKLRVLHPGVRVSALGGIHLRREASDFLYSLVDVGGFGFWEPLLKIPQLWTALKAVKASIRDDRPDIVVPIDYYGFNIHVARLAHHAGIPVAYYVSPQVWASRPGRLRKLAAYVTKMLVIFPFESALYEKAKIPVSFVGHPLVERMPVPDPESTEPTIGLLPGSRRGTILRHLPVLVQTAQLLRGEFPQACWILFRAEGIEEAYYKPFLSQAPWIQITLDPSYESRKRLWLAIGVSGTAALENMLLGIPMIVMYKLSQVTYWIAKGLIRVPYIGIPNLLANRKVVPELIQDKATPDTLAQTAKAILQDRLKRDKMREALLALRSTLGEGGSARAAGEILGMVS